MEESAQMNSVVLVGALITVSAMVHVQTDVINVASELAI
jgi:hypothetical protein